MDKDKFSINFFFHVLCLVSIPLSRSIKDTLPINSVNCRFRQSNFRDFNIEMLRIVRIWQGEDCKVEPTMGAKYIILMQTDRQNTDYCLTSFSRRMNAIYRND